MNENTETPLSGQSKHPEAGRAGACASEKNPDCDWLGRPQIPESLWSRDDQMRVRRVTVAPRHLHRTGAVPMNSCQGQQ